MGGLDTAAGREDDHRLPVIFVTGLHRSGTTVVTKALASASGGTSLTVGDLAAYLPGLRELCQDPASPIDRGVDRQKVAPDLVEEYCWFLQTLTRRGPVRYRRGLRGQMASLIRDVGRRARPVILKNPWDTGNEARLLRSFPAARLVIVRRRLGESEASLGHALERLAREPEYVLALNGNSLRSRLHLRALRRPVACAMLSMLSRWQARMRLVRLLLLLRFLPLERVAFLSYDELRDDPDSAAAWAEHIVDRSRLAATFTDSIDRQSSVGERRRGVILALLDRRWQRAWDRARAAQVQAGVLSPRV